MSKLTFLLALYAAGLVTYVAFFQPAPEGVGGAEVATSNSEAAWRREVVDRARLEARAEIQPKLKELEAWKARLEAIRSEMQEELSDLDQWVEETSRLSAGGLDSIKERLKPLAGIDRKLAKIGEEIETHATRIKSLEDRPPVVREIVKEVATRPSSQPTGPKVPTLPVEQVEDPEVVREKVVRAMMDLKSDEPAKLWAAINIARKYKVKQAVPRLIQILGDHRNIMMKRTAAQALGPIGLVDAVPPLVSAMVGHDDALGKFANDAIRQITGFDTQLPDEARIKARRRAKNAFLAWWRENEEAVRTRLEQPKKG